MSRLKNVLQDATNLVAKIYYVDRFQAKLWNNMRGSEVRIFTGWYWTDGTKEKGPFKTKSAAIRDAYYICVMKCEPPLLTEVNVNTISTMSMPVARKTNIVPFSQWKKQA